MFFVVRFSPPTLRACLKCGDGLLSEIRVVLAHRGSWMLQAGLLDLAAVALEHWISECLLADEKVTV